MSTSALKRVSQFCIEPNADFWVSGGTDLELMETTLEVFETTVHPFGPT